MTKQEREFMQSHIFNYETIKSGYVRNLDVSVLNEYEKIYKNYLDKNFVLTKWCSDCVYDTLKRLYEYYFSLPEEDIHVTDISVQSIEWHNAIEIDREKRKRGRPKK